eukprot:TRINITY_DN38516_c0_g1_i1.p1 TRINITY_DN38516_c0_g1~~TRINITY_DN38516_c0_g1_i1.p1  ORF type:complete len:640 (+),score=46.77 TRINITY_DN38516_c0_g1_i1:78-1922(+)
MTSSVTVWSATFARIFLLLVVALVLWIRRKVRENLEDLRQVVTRLQNTDRKQFLHIPDNLIAEYPSVVARPSQGPLDRGYRVPGAEEAGAYSARRTQALGDVVPYGDAIDAGCVSVSLGNASVTLMMNKPVCNGHRCPTCVVITDAGPGARRTLTILGCSSTLLGEQLALGGSGFRGAFHHAIIEFVFMNADTSTYTVITDGVGRRTTLAPLTSASAFCYTHSLRDVLYFSPPLRAVVGLSEFRMLEESYLGDHGKFSSCVLAGNAKIDCAPHRDGRTLEIDTTAARATSRQLVSQYFSIGGGALYQRGSCVLARTAKIYCGPFSAAKVIEIDPTGHVASDMQIGSSFSGTNLFRSCLLAVDGQIYCAPCRHNQVLLINPVDSPATTTLLTETYNGSDLYWACALAGNAKIYCPHFDATGTLEIDPASASSMQLSSLETGGGFRSAALAPNGKIYCAPYSGTNVMEIDPTVGTVVFKVFGSFGKGRRSYVACSAVANNWNIYCAPRAAVHFLEINPTDVNASGELLPETYTDEGQAFAQPGVVAGNGKVFFAPSSARTIVEIDPTGIETTSKVLGTIPSSLGSQYNTCVIGGNGNIYCPPLKAAEVLEIDPGVR